MDLFKITIIYSIISTLILLYYSGSIGKKLKIIDEPSKINIHKTPVPLVGGFLYLNIFFSIILFEFLSGKISFLLFFSLLFSLIIFFLIGFYDDRNSIKGSKRTILFLFSSLFFVLSLQNSFDLTKIFFKFGATLNFGYWNIIFYALCITGLQIVLNLIDGVNGLLKIYFLTFLFLFEKYLVGYLSLFSIAFFPATILILIFNFKNKVFLGSSGNSILTLILSFLILKGLSNNETPIYFEEILLIFIIPFIDCLKLFIQRLSKFKNIFKKEKNHLHHILLSNLNLILCLIVYFIMSFLPFILYVSFKMNIYMLLLSILSIYLLSIKLLKNKKI